MGGITFEPTVTIGLIIQTIVLGATGLFFIWNMKKDIALITSELGHLQSAQKALTEAFSQLGKILTQVAVQDTRINMIERRIDELSHGKGYVKSRNEKED